MADKRTTPDKGVELQFPTTGYNKTLFFNKFSIEDAEIGVFLNFWYLDKMGRADNGYCCFVAKVDVDRFVTSFKPYIEKIGLEPDLVSERPLSGACYAGAPLVSHFRCSRVGEVGELDLVFIPMYALIEKKLDGAKVEVQPVAALMSSLQIHINFICQFIKAVEVKK